MRVAPTLFFFAAIAIVGTVLLVAESAEASHFRGGTLSWEPTDDPLEAEFSGKLAVRRDGHVVGDLVNFGGMIHYGDGIQEEVWFLVTEMHLDEDWYLAEMRNIQGNSLTHKYPATLDQGAPWRAYFNGTCRHDTAVVAGYDYEHMNNPCPTILRMETDVDLENGDTSAVAVGFRPLIRCPPPPITCTFVVTGTDIDGEAIHHRLATPSEAGPNFKQPHDYPAPGTTSLKIDPDTGLVEWDTLGLVMSTNHSITQYSMQVVLESGPNPTRVAVDFLIEFCGQFDQIPPMDINRTVESFGRCLPSLPCELDKPPTLPPTKYVFDETIGALEDIIQDLPRVPDCLPLPCELNIPPLPPGDTEGWFLDVVRDPSTLSDCLPPLPCEANLPPLPPGDTEGWLRNVSRDPEALSDCVPPVPPPCELNVPLLPPPDPGAAVGAIIQDPSTLSDCVPPLPCHVEIGIPSGPPPPDFGAIYGAVQNTTSTDCLDPPVDPCPPPRIGVVVEGQAICVDPSPSCWLQFVFGLPSATDPDALDDLLNNGTVTSNCLPPIPPPCKVLPQPCPPVIMPCPYPQVGVHINNQYYCITPPPVLPCPPPQVGVVVNGQAVCVTAGPCPAGTVGATVNGQAVCVPVPPVGPCPPPKIGVVVNGTAVCVSPLPTCWVQLALALVTDEPGSLNDLLQNGTTPSNCLPPLPAPCSLLPQPCPPTIDPCPTPQVGVWVNGQPICVTPPPVVPCPTPQVGVVVNGQAVCVTIDHCPPGMIGATINGQPVCVLIPDVAPCPPPEVGIVVSGVPVCVLSEPCPPGELGTKINGQSMCVDPTLACQFYFDWLLDGRATDPGFVVSEVTKLQDCIPPIPNP